MNDQGSVNYAKDSGSYLLIAILVIVAVVLIGVLLYFIISNPNGGINNNPTPPVKPNIPHKGAGVPNGKNLQQRDVDYGQNLNVVEPDNISGDSVEMSIPSNNNRDLSQGEVMTPEEIMVEEIKGNSSEEFSEQEIFAQKDKKHNLVSSEDVGKREIYDKGFKPIKNNPRSEHYKNKNYYSGDTSYPKSS